MTMQMTLINHPRINVTRVTGVEGPHHDPYEYQEFVAKTPDGVVRYHRGLAVWIKINGVDPEWPMTQDFDEYVALCEQRFELAAGFTLEQIERIHRKSKERCPKCGGKDFECTDGFPGESLIICASCGHTHDSMFCVSAIM